MSPSSSYRLVRTNHIDPRIKISAWIVATIVSTWNENVWRVVRLETHYRIETERFSSRYLVGMHIVLGIFRIHIFATRIKRASVHLQRGMMAHFRNMRAPTRVVLQHTRAPDVHSFRVGRDSSIHVSFYTFNCVDASWMEFAGDTRRWDDRYLDENW